MYTNQDHRLDQEIGTAILANFSDYLGMCEANNLAVLKGNFADF